MNEIQFHLKTGEHGYLSNFFSLPRPLLLEGKEWPTSEHYFQAQQFINTDPDHAEAIRLTKPPIKAWRMGNDDSHPRCADWKMVKDDVMRKAVRAKFRQNPELRDKLLATDDARLVEHTPSDSYWGDGGDGKGLNRLGEILMQIRTELRCERPSAPNCPKDLCSYSWDDSTGKKANEL